MSDQNRLGVFKTYKLYVGDLVLSESCWVYR